MSNNLCVIHLNLISYFTRWIEHLPFVNRLGLLIFIFIFPLTANAKTWHEIARPQVHGYDMQAICSLARFKFASGAEEKIVRTFQAPVNFIENFKTLCSIADSSLDEIIECLYYSLFVYFSKKIFEKGKFEMLTQNIVLFDFKIPATPKGASVPSLGLSNKAVFDESIPVAADDRHIKDQYPDNYFVPISLQCKRTFSWNSS